MAKAAKAVPQGYHSITPQLTLDNAAQTIDWYKANESWWRSIKSGEYLKYYERQYAGR